VAGTKLSICELSESNFAGKGNACAWRIVHFLVFHTVEYKLQLENVFAQYLIFSSLIFLFRSSVRNVRLLNSVITVQFLGLWKVWYLSAN
jgi:hypothetical protein